jgi:malonate transporter and related proteins
VVFKLLGIFAIIAIGWLAGRTRVLGADAAVVLGRAVFGVFTPALLFRTMTGIAVARLPAMTLAAYFLPTLSMLLLMYGWHRVRHPGAPTAAAVRGLSASFSNTVQLGIPLVSAVFGAAGLVYLIAIISLQSLVLLTIATVLAEAGRAALSRRGRNVDGRAASSRRGRNVDGLSRLGRSLPSDPMPEEVGSRVALRTARRTLIHPVVLPVLLGLGYNAAGLTIPGPVDDVLATMGQAVVPVSLVTIGLTLFRYGFGSAGRAVTLSLGKLVVQPAVVLAVAYLLFGLRGLPLEIVVICAALPIGSNVLLFADRYDVAQAETTAAIVASTCAFLVTGAGWLLVLARLA